MKNYLLALTIVVLTSVSGFAQADAHLKKLTDDAVLLRKAKASNDVLNKTVINWSSSGSPKITLMDEIKRDAEHEFRGSGANKFRMNQVVAHVYRRQNTGMVSKGDYFNSTEKDIYYSAIEKNVKRGCTVSYSITGHIGVQEFVFMAFHPNSKFSVKVNGASAQPMTGQSGVLYFKLPKVKKGDKIVLSITNESGANESFVILNHNPQK